MLSKDQIQRAMDEWLTTVGLHPAEEHFIQELRKRAATGEIVFRETAKFLYMAMPETVLSAIQKARAQGKCRSWPSA